MTIDPDVCVTWQRLPERHPAWNSKRCLYAYVAPDLKEILYIGKCWGVTVSGRWARGAKEYFWEDLERDRRFQKHLPLHGEVELNYNGRLSHALLADVESLLIVAEKPWGNIQCITARQARPQLIVECSGHWPGKARFYKDNAE